MPFQKVAGKGIVKKAGECMGCISLSCILGGEGKRESIGGAGGHSYSQ